jgi:hypothetical protein
VKETNVCACCFVEQQEWEGLDDCTVATIIIVIIIHHVQLGNNLSLRDNEPCDVALLRDLSSPCVS